MDTKHSHLVQVGEIGQEVVLFFEDYAHTYLKKHQEQDKLYVYGEIIKEENKEKIYIYGISAHGKSDREYFQEYESLGFLKMGEENLSWFYGKREEVINGYYIFYATNKSMQEYLISQSKEGKERTGEQVETRKRKEISQAPVREILLSKSYLPGKNSRAKKGISSLVPIALVAVILFSSMVFSENARKKADVFKEIVTQVIRDEEKETEDIIIEDIVIEEKDLNSSAEEVLKENVEVSEEAISAEVQNENNENVVEAAGEEVTILLEAETVEEEEIMDEYIVAEGDTLAGICQKIYGTDERMKEIIAINEITDEDYIAPGQKLYLPK